MQTFEILDRFELLYPSNDNLADLRRSYNDQDFSSIFRLTNGDEELRKAVIEKNIHSIFRLLGDCKINGDIEDLRKVVTETNLHSLFRLVESEDLRKAVTEDNLHSIFRFLDDDDLRKLILEDNTWKLFPLLDRYVDTQFTAAFKSFFVNKIEFDKDCFSRGQIQSKLWLVQMLQEHCKDLGTVFLCAGWYATLATMLFESDCKVEKIRSFDIDPTCVDIAETFNKPWFKDKWRYKSITQDIMDVNYDEHTWEFWSKANNRMSYPILDIPNTIINTSCEHILDFKTWYNKIPEGKLVVLQSNNYTSVDEHVNCVKDVNEFQDMAPMKKLLFVGNLPLPKYERFMLIGYK